VSFPILILLLLFSSHMPLGLTIILFLSFYKTTLTTLMISAPPSTPPSAPTLLTSIANYTRFTLLKNETNDNLKLIKPQNSRSETPWQADLPKDSSLIPFPPYLLHSLPSLIHNQTSLSQDLMLWSPLQLLTSRNSTTTHIMLLNTNPGLNHLWCQIFMLTHPQTLFHGLSYWPYRT